MEKRAFRTAVGGELLGGLLAALGGLALTACQGSSHAQAATTAADALGPAEVACGLSVYPGAALKAGSGRRLADPHLYSGQPMQTVEFTTADSMDRVVGWYATHWLGAIRSGVAGAIITFDRSSRSGPCEVDIYPAERTTIKFLLPTTATDRSGS